MTLGVNPWDIYHNGAWYNRDGSGGPLPIGDYDSHAAEHAAIGIFRAYPEIKERNSSLVSQPAGITKSVVKAGKLVCRFLSSEWTAYGAALKEDHSGYDANGEVTGVVSRTGLPSILKVTPGDNVNEGVSCSTSSVFRTKATNGLVGLWCYVPNIPGYAPGGTPSGSITLDLSTSTSFGNHLSVSFNINNFKEGWNFLVFRQRNPNAYLAGQNAVELHPWGVLPTTVGTGANSDILNNDIAAVRVLMSGNAGDMTGLPFYLDSLWTDFDAIPQVMIGHDTADSTIQTLALPLYQANGWKGYVTANADYWDGTESRILADYENTLLMDGIKVFADLGWDVIPHGMFHLPGSVASPKMAALTDAGEVAYEYVGMRGVLFRNGIYKGSDFWIAPQNSFSRLTEKVIREAGAKMQRGYIGCNIHVTPFGIANPAHTGAVPIGVVGAAGYVSTTNGTSTAITGMNSLIKCLACIDMLLEYRASMNLYTHSLETAGDAGTGEGSPASPENCLYSCFKGVVDHIREKELAQECEVVGGMSEFFYGL